MPRGRKPSGESEREELLRKARARREAAISEMPPGHYDLVAKLSRLMKIRGMNQSSLADVIAQHFQAGRVAAIVHQTRISKWLKRSGEPNHAQTQAMAEALRVPLAYLADPTRTEEPDMDMLDREYELERTVRRIGVLAALDRVNLRASVPVISTVPVDHDATYQTDPRPTARPKGGSRAV